MSEEFYPSITKHLLLKAIEHAKLYTSIYQQELDIILHARKCLLFSKNKLWEKTVNESLFDITMGSYDGAEICELMVDGLACLHKISGPASDKIRKDMIRPFRENLGLKITITTNL